MIKTQALQKNKQTNKNQDRQSVEAAAGEQG